MPSTIRDFIGYGKSYPKISWPDSARIAISIVVNVESGAERTPLYGDPMGESKGEGFEVPFGLRDVRNESLFDYGSRAGFWRLMDVFDTYGVKVTFCAAAVALERNPVAAREITARGHEPAGHGYRWFPSYLLSRQEELDAIRKAVESIRQTTGDRPYGWNARGLSENTRELLIEEGGFIYDFDTYADDLPYFVDVNGTRWLTVPYSFETNDMKYRQPPGLSDPDDFFFLLKAAFDCLYEEGATHPKMMTVGLHTHFSGRPARADALDQFLRYAGGFPGVWFARRIDIARWWLDNYSHLPTLRH